MNAGSIDPWAAPAAEPPAPVQVVKGTEDEARPEHRQRSARLRHGVDRLELSEASGVGQAYAKFTIHEKTGQVAIKIVDSATNEVIREIPPEQAIEMAEQMKAYLAARTRILGSEKWPAPSPSEGSSRA
jgi:uncharacterized FlaG/YvyC family protein